MRRDVKSLIREKLQKSDADVLFASLFGSYRRGDYDAFSDIDVLVVCGDEDEKTLISSELKRLEPMLNRSLHVSLFSRREFESRVRFHDYLATSIIEDSSFIFGRRGFFAEAKRKLLEGLPDGDSIRFNVDMGFRTLRHLYLRLSGVSLNGSSHRGDLFKYVMKGLNDYRLGLGYLCAGALMQRSGGGVSFTRLMQTGFGSVLKNVAYVENVVKRRSVDYMVLSRLANEIRDESLRVLTSNSHDPLRGANLLIKSRRENLLPKLFRAD